MIAVDIPAVVCVAEFSWPCGWALRTVSCESSDDPDAIDPSGRYRGLWQVEGGSLDPEENTREASVQYEQWMRGERPNPWPWCGR